MRRRRGRAAPDGDRWPTTTPGSPRRERSLWWFEALVTPERADAIARRREELAGRLARPRPARPFATRDWRWIPTPAGHAEAVEACRTRIRAGDLFQANLCLRLAGRLEGDAFDLFATAAAALPTDRTAFVAGPWGTVASLSPELFLARGGRTGPERADQGHPAAGRGRSSRRPGRTAPRT
jgi:anthranilate/para-aminobenzoate synthase component I